MALHALHVRLGGLGGDTEGEQHLDHEPMPGAHAPCEFMACLGQKDAVARLGRRQAFAPEAGDALDRRWVRDAHALGDIGRARLVLAPILFTLRVGWRR